MGHVFEMEAFSIANEDASNAVEVAVRVNLTCVHAGTPPSGTNGPPEFYDPGSPPEWEIENIEIHADGGSIVKMTEKEFIDIFPEGQDVVNNAYEDAAHNGEVE